MKRGRAAIDSIFGALVGAGIGLCVGILGTFVGSIAEKALDTTVVGYEMGTLAVPLGCVVGGLFVGALGALSGSAGRGFFIGLALCSLFCLWWLVGSWSFPLGVRLWAVAAWATVGGTAGAVGGVVRQHLGRNSGGEEAGQKRASGA
jgi:hypothetical protein